MQQWMLYEKDEVTGMKMIGYMRAVPLCLFLEPNVCNHVVACLSFHSGEMPLFLDSHSPLRIFRNYGTIATWSLTRKKLKPHHLPWVVR